MKTDITRLLQEAEQGGAEAASALLKRVYATLKTIAAAQIAREAPGQTLQPTALVHEAWMRLVDEEGRARFSNRTHFYTAAAEAMRRIRVDRARRRQAEKRGSGWAPVSRRVEDHAAPAPPEEVLAVHDALDKLAQLSPRKAELVKLRYFVGLTFAEAASLLGISVPTAERDWAYARAWLRAEIRPPSSSAAS